MGVLGKYLVRGHFEGNFKTDQQKVLTSGEPFPQGDEHRVKIFRGIISNTEEITEEVFSQSSGLYNFRELNNIQINTSDKWPIKNDRIFYLNKMKLANVHVSNVQSLNGKTVGVIKGDVVASVAEGTFEEKVDDTNYIVNDPQNPNPTSNHDNTQKEKENKGNGDGSIGGGNSSGGGNNPDGADPNNFDKKRIPLWRRPGCNDKWLRWLLFILCILILLYLLAKCTQIGQKVYCKIDEWRLAEEERKLRSELDTLEWKIDETDPTPAPCGSSIDKEGTNEPWEKSFSLGDKSGTVAIEFDAMFVPDRLEVIYDGHLVAQTNRNFFLNSDTSDYTNEFDNLIGLGFGQYDTTLFFSYNYNINKPNEMLIRVIPNKEITSTKWYLKTYCPR